MKGSHTWSWVPWFAAASAGLLLWIATNAGAGDLQPVEVLPLAHYSEGPVFDYAGNLFVSHSKLVTKLSPDGRAETWFTAEGTTGGHKILPDGTHLLCAGSAVWRLGAAGRVLGKAAFECEGKPLRSPNDLTLDREGGFYFTDPGGSGKSPIGTVHYVDEEGTTHLVAGGMYVPNGLVLSPDGRTLYVAETIPNRVLKFTVLESGRLGPIEVFANLPSKSDGSEAVPDGLAVDTKGNLYVAHLGMSAVQVLDPAGKLLRSLPAGNYDASNLVFGGPNLDQLYITGSTGHRSNTPGKVYRLDLKGVRGVSALLARSEPR